MSTVEETADEQSTIESATQETPSEPIPKSEHIPKTEKPHTLKSTGEFNAGIADMKVTKTTLDLSRTQRITFENDGKKYEYIRTRIY